MVVIDNIKRFYCSEMVESSSSQGSDMAMQGKVVIGNSQGFFCSEKMEFSSSYGSDIDK
jgi:hypothetical protein